jgi:hypothetical protein
MQSGPSSRTVEKKPAAEPSSVPGARAAGEKTSSPKPAAGTEPSRNRVHKRDMYLNRQCVYESSGTYRKRLRHIARRLNTTRKTISSNIIPASDPPGSFAEAVITPGRRSTSGATMFRQCHHGIAYIRE